MKLQDKLVQLRKKNGMSQLELADAVNVSRQAISKWELGTAIPTIENLISISKLYGVSVDYLVNDEAISDFDTPTVKVIRDYYKLSYKSIMIRIIVAVVVAAGAIIVGIANQSLSTAIVFLLLAGTVTLVYSILHWLYRYIVCK